MQRILRILVATSLLCFPIVCQSGNEVVFVGTSVGGSTDPHHFVWSGTGSTTGGGNTFTDNVTGAVWADTGRNLYVAQSLRNRVSHASWNGSSATWSTFWNAPGACYSLFLDRGRQRLWVLTGPTGSTRELYCLDADPSSSGYGTLLAQTSSLSGTMRERWILSLSGNYAVVPPVFLGNGPLEIVDTDPASPQFLQIVASAPVPGLTGISIPFSSDVAISTTDQFVYLLYVGLVGSSTVQGIAVFHIPTATWLDFDPAPGIQHFVLSHAVPNRMSVSLDTSFAVVSGQGGSGWCGRVDWDYATPTNTTFTEFLPGQGLLPDCNAASLSLSNDRLAVTATSPGSSTSGQLVILDTATGALLQNVTISPASNIYTTAWQDASPTATYVTFGSGCSGTLGIPTLSAANSSRPALGTTFTVLAQNLPTDLGIMATGLSNSSTGGLSLPLDLGSFGMPGCFQLVDAMAVQFLIGSGNSATWNWNIPGSQAWFGMPFYQQVFAIDPGINTLGMTVSAGRRGVLGF